MSSASDTSLFQQQLAPTFAFQPNAPHRLLFGLSGWHLLFMREPGAWWQGPPGLPPGVTVCPGASLLHLGRPGSQAPLPSGLNAALLTPAADS